MSFTITAAPKLEEVHLSELGILIPDNLAQKGFPGSMSLLHLCAELCVIMRFPRKTVTAFTRFSRVEEISPKVEHLL